MEQCGIGLPPLQQCQGIPHARAGRHAAPGGAVYTDLCRVHLSEGTAGLDGPNGIPDRALSPFQPAARADATLAHVSADAAAGGPVAGTPADGRSADVASAAAAYTAAVPIGPRSGVVYHIDASYFI